MRVLITGGNGLLGQKLVALLAQNHDLTLIVTSRGENRNPKGNYTYHSSELTVQSEVESLIKTVQPTHIIHCAAMTQVDQCEKDQDGCWQSNVLATKYLLDAAQALQSHFLYVSTDFVFDGESGPYSEEDLANPISHYGKSKLAAELLVKGSGLSWAVARTVLVYGVTSDMSRSNIVLWVKKSLAAKQQIKVVTDQWRTPTLAEDLAEGCWLISKNSYQGIYHLSGAEGMSPYELSIKVAEHFGLKKSLITPVNNSTFTQAGKRPPKTGFVIEKAKKVLGFEPKSFSEGLDIMSRQILQ